MMHERQIFKQRDEPIEFLPFALENPPSKMGTKAMHPTAPMQ